MDAGTLLGKFAPGGVLQVPLSCSLHSVPVLGTLTIADQGAVACTMESCGQLDGVCDAKDVPKLITVHFDTFSLRPKGPDLIEAAADVTLNTNGRIMAASPSANHPLCLFTDRLKLSADLDSTRAAPPDISLAAGIRFTVDTRWWKLLSFEVASLDGTKACGSSGALPSPACVDAADMIIRSENGCSSWLGTVGNINLVKDFILGQLTTTIQDELQKKLADANCRDCESDGTCPTNGAATSLCRYDAGTSDAGECFDPAINRCVPAVLGVEDRIDVATLLRTPASPLDVLVAAGGATTASDAGFTAGFTGGAQEVATASCVKPLPEPGYPLLPLPDFDQDAPGPYDLGVSVSQQLVARLLLHAQQSGALCLELGHDQIALLDTSVVGSALGSLAKLTHGQVVPLKVAVRPNNPPTASFGSGVAAEPLITLEWSAAQVDVYALLEDRYARLFSVTFDLKLPLKVTIDGCATLTPVIGNLMSAVTNVHAINSETLAEPLQDIEALVPSLISFAEPALAKGLSGFSVPAVSGFQVKLLSVQGVGNVAGTKAFDHLGVYAQLLPAAQQCMRTAMHKAEIRAAKLGKGGAAQLDVTSRDQEYSWRIQDGLWSDWVHPSATGVLEIQHPRLLLDGRHVIEVRTKDAQHAPSRAVSVVLER
jgi:hypothetical protein